MTSMKKRIAAALTAATLIIGLTVPAAAAEAPNEPIRVSSYKGSTLEVGERSGLIIGPSGADYTVTSSDPDTVAVEQITGFWVAVAKGAGTAEIVAANRAGARLSENGKSFRNKIFRSRLDRRKNKQHLSRRIIFPH